MKAHEVMDYQDKVSGIIYVSDLLRCDGYYGEAAELDLAAESMTVLLEQLRSNVANDG